MSPFQTENWRKFWHENWIQQAPQHVVVVVPTGMDLGWNRHENSFSNTIVAIARVIRIAIYTTEKVH
jgi:hypothetical protein